MLIDMHVHLADIEALSGKIAQGGGKSLGRLVRAVNKELSDDPGEGGLNKRWVKCVAYWVEESQLDRALLLALDGVYDESGKACPEKSVLQVDNEFIASFAGSGGPFLFGASLHPYRKDAVDQLEKLVKQGAKLIKWIPSAQYIEPDNKLCFPFYEAMADFGIPLLTHTGIEHSLGMRRIRYNHPAKLVPALEKGVKVIAAHCGVHLFLHEPSFFGSWARLAREYEHLYGDTGAFAVVTRISYLKKILRDKELLSKLLYGSDYPGIPSPKWCWQLGFKKMSELSQIKNPLEKYLQVMQAVGLPREVLERAGHLLQIKEKELVNEL